MKCPSCHAENRDASRFCSSCGAPLNVEETLPASLNQTVTTPLPVVSKDSVIAGKYKVLEELGRGGMGVVYKAEDIQLKRTVALKFLPPERTHVPELRERFMHEAQAAAALNDSNIVTIFEINEHQKQTYIAMEYVEGQTLKDRIDRGPLPLEEAVDIALQIAEGLRKAHHKEIVHRDIKPANIIITDEGVAKILDFGVAKLRGTTRLTHEGTTIGTAAYMSPEQASGKEADRRSDIWSLGVILYEMIIGRQPFRGEHHQAVIYAILNEEPEPVTGLRSGVPLELERIINKALAKDPEERYQTVADLKVDLKTLAKRGEATATSPSIAGKIKQEAMAKKGPPALKRIGIAAAGLIVILAAAALLLFRAPSGTIDSLAVLPFVNQSSDDNLAWLSTGIPETVITSLQQIPKLRVTSFLSLLERYRDAQPSVEDVKRHYDVRAVAKGRVSVVRESLSVHIEIVDTRNQSVIFANQYRIEDMEGLLDLQKSIARDITEHLQTRLAGKSAEPVFSRHAPDSAAYHNYLRGRYFWYKRTPRDLERALEYFQKAIAVDPGFALAWSGLSDTYHLMPQGAGASRYRVIPLAREAAEKALELDDTLAETQTSMGGVLNSEQKFAEAEKHFQKAIELNPNYLLAYHWSGVNLGDWRQDKEAIERYQEALRLDPMSPIIAANLSLEYRNMGHYDRAKEILDKAISLNPESSTPYIQYAWLLRDRGDPQKAVEMAEKAFSLDSTSLFSIQHVVYICLYAKNYDRAIEILEGMMAREPAFQRPGHALLGITYQRMKEYEKALEHHRKAIDIDPLDVDSYWDLGDTYYYFKEWQKAADAYQKIIELEPEEGDALQMLGCVLGILGRTEEEWECYQRATHLNPVHSIELGVWHLNYGDYEKAVSGLIKAEKDSPNYANNRFYLFTAQFLSGDFKGAERSLSEWLSRIDYKGRDALRAQAFPDGSVNRSSVIRYVRLILERFKEENREIGGRYEARLPATFYCLTGDFESAIETLEYAYENFEEKAFWLPWYIRFSYFKPLHDDPRFRELITKLKLDPYFSRDNLPRIK